MDVTFSSASLAALCNSETRLTRRWGPAAGRTVARRLLDLAATDAATIDRLPEATLSLDGDGVATIVFSEEVVIRGVISDAPSDTTTTRGDADCLLITSVDVDGGGQR